MKLDVVRIDVTVWLGTTGEIPLQSCIGYFPLELWEKHPQKCIEELGHVLETNKASRPCSDCGGSGIGVPTRIYKKPPICPTCKGTGVET